MNRISACDSAFVRLTCHWFRWIGKACAAVAAVAWLFAPPALRAADDWHTFTAADGRRMEAKILRVEHDFVLVELKKDRRQIPIDFDMLSEADVAFLRDYNFRKRQAPSPTPGGGGGREANDDDAVEGDPEMGRFYPRTRQQIQSGIREIEARHAPKGLSREVQNAVNRLNVYRFLCGVPSEVEGDPEFSKNATEAAEACKQQGQLSHSIGHFTDRCNLTTDGDMVNSVAGYIGDGGANNREARGHRSWCLNAQMGKVGFGSAGDRYSAMWCMDTSGRSVRGTWAYPGKGLFPLDYLHGNAWSVYGTGTPDSADKLKVEMFKLPKRPDKTPTGDEPGRRIKVEYVSLGRNAINFEPEQPVKRGIYWIRISGGGVSESYLVELY